MAQETLSIEQQQAMALAAARVRSMTHTQSSGQGNTAYDPTADMSGGERALAAVGGRMQDYGLGARQAVSGLTGNTDALRKEAAEKRKVDAPLEKTTGGRLGSLATDIALLAPTMAIPGVNTMRGASALGAATGFAQPSASTAETIGNTALGTAAGAGGQWVGNKLVSAASPAAPLAPRQQVAADTINAGYSIPPSEVKPSLWNRLLSGGNRQAMADEASLRNTRALSDNLKKELPGIQGDITPETLGAYRQAQYQAGYKPVESLPGLVPKQVGTWNAPSGQSPIMGKTPSTPDALLHDWKSSNSKISELWSDYRRNARVETLDAIRVATAKQLSIQKGLEDAANAAGKPELIAALQKARTNIAKSHDIERSMRDTAVPTAGNLASTSTSGKLSGELEAAYTGAKNFPDAFKNPASMQPSTAWGSTLVGAALGGVGDAGSNSAGYGHTGAALAALPFLKGGARQMALSRIYQQSMVNPEASAITQAIKSKISTPELQALAQLLRKGAPQAALVGVE